MDNDCQKILSKYINYVPAIIIPDKEIEISKRRFLLPRNETFGFCCVSIRKHIKLKPSEAVFFLIENKIMDMRQNVGEFYDRYKLKKNPDTAYLYIQILKEKTFGAIPLAVGRTIKSERIYRNVPWIRSLQKSH